MSAVTLQKDLGVTPIQSTDQQVGRVNGRDVKPVSHNGQVQATGVGGISINTIMLIVGICLWACGTTPQMVLAGKILVGISLGASCCLCCVVFCALGIATSSKP